MRGRAGARGVVAIAAVLLTMVFAAGSASATTTKLCEVNTSPCPAGKTYPSLSPFEVVGHAWIDSYVCEFLFDFKTTAASGAPLLSKIFLVEFSNCSPTLTVTAKGLVWSYYIGVTGTGPNGVGEIYEGGSTTIPVEIEANIGGTGHCVYKLPNLSPTVLGGSWTFVSITAILTSGGGVCPSTTTFAFEAVPTPEFFVTD